MKFCFCGVTDPRGTINVTARPNVQIGPRFQGLPVFPDIEPYDRGLLDVGNDNAIYWECCGKPDGKPAVYVHGGPGSGSRPGARRFFDPDIYRIVLFDQRGCGSSRPLLNHPSQLRTNTTHHLIRDLELLRKHLSIERWTMLGVSWGTTLALAYAETFPHRVSALVLACVTTTSRREVDWITCGVGRVFPQQWERLRAHLPESLKDDRIIDAYAKLLFDDDAHVRAAAAAEWCAWEDSHVSLAPGHVPNPRFSHPDFHLRFARIVTHYWRHAAFLEDGEILNNVHSVDGVPGILIHGRYDISTPLETAWQLHRRWRSSELRVVGDAGHGGDNLAQTVAAALTQLGEKHQRL